MAKSGRLELGDNIYECYRSIFNQCDVFGQQIHRNWRKNAKQGLLRRSRSSKVIKVDNNRKPVCDFLLVTYDILSRTVSEISQLIVQILDTLRF